MADERKCYAGDLGSDALGKVIRFTFGNGETMDLRVENIEHEQRPRPGKLTTLRGQLVGTHRYAGKPDTWALNSETSIVEVLP